jgi:hypothetical protein
MPLEAQASECSYRQLTEKEDPMYELDEATLPLHSDLARLYFDAQKAHLRALAAAASEPVPGVVQNSIDSTQATEYKPVTTAFGGLFFMTIDTTIKSGGKSYDFSGLGGGLGFGASVSWGAAWLNYPLDVLDGWDFRFEANLGVTVVNVQWWGMQGEYIGSFVGAGVSIAAGIFGGKGSISS